MSQDDSFSTPGDNDRTLIRPMPGGRRATGAPPPPSGASAKVAPTPSGAPPVGTGLNPLTGCASPLLIAAGELRNSTVHPDPEGLRSRLVNEVRTFEGCARAKGIPENHVLTARYVLCSLLELMYLCLALGFKGRYAREGGRDQLELVRERLYQTIRAQHGDPERELSPNWRGIVEQRDPLIRTLPLWVLSALAGVFLLILFAGFNHALHSDSDPVFLALGKLDVPTVEVPRTPPPVAERPLSLRILLADEIDAHRVEILDGPRGQTETIVIQGDNLFRSGRASINKRFLSLLERPSARR